MSQQKRSFAVDTSSLATEKPLLETGMYAGVITNAGTSFKSGDKEVNTIGLRQKTKWNKNKKASEPVAGEYEIAGRFSFGAALTSKKAIQVLQRDEPQVFGGQFYLNFNQEHSLDVNNNIVLRALLTTLGLQDTDFSSQVDFEWDDDIATEDNIKSVFAFKGETEADRDEEFAGVSSYADLTAALNGIVWARKYFDLIAESVNGQAAIVKVVKKDNYKNPSIKENGIDTGTAAAPFVGILSYKEGFEFDLEEDD
jgi:hypothetical protein